MKKNNAIALIGYIAIVTAPMMGLTGIIMGVVLICIGARIRQALGLIIMGGIAGFFLEYIFTPFHPWESLTYYLVLMTIPSMITYRFTKE